jgi:hypothetical protein
MLEEKTAVMKKYPLPPMRTLGEDTALVKKHPLPTKPTFYKKQTPILYRFSHFCKNCDLKKLARLLLYRTAF